MRVPLVRFALIRFALVDLAGSLVYLVLLWSLVEALGWPVVPASCCAFLLVVLENYLLHRAWTFRSSVPHRQALPAFLFASMTGLCINGAVMRLGVEWLGLHYLAVQLAALSMVVACNFLWAQRAFQAKWTFSSGKDMA